MTDNSRVQEDTPHARRNGSVEDEIRAETPLVLTDEGRAALRFLHAPNDD